MKGHQCGKEADCITTKTAHAASLSLEGNHSLADTGGSKAQSPKHCWDFTTLVVLDVILHLPTGSSSLHKSNRTTEIHSKITLFVKMMEGVDHAKKTDT